GVLTGGTVGYEIFNQPSFGLSDFIQQVDYQRALEGEIARSIDQIDVVDSARVHLAIPQPSVFVSQQKDPSAAVIVALKPGQELTKAQAQAIVNLVVGAVSGMKPSQVVLLDTQGQLLHKEGTTNGLDPASATDQYDTQLAMEQNLETRLQDMLDRVLGPGHSTAQVSLDLDWSTSEATSETYNPNAQPTQVANSQDVVDSQGAGATAGGVPGVTSNVPTYQQNPTPGPAGSGTTHTESSRTYDVSRTVQKTTSAPGTVTRISVAVAVDSSLANPAMVTSLTTMIQSAVGYDAKRGDVVTVVPVALKPVAADNSAATSAGAQKQQQTLALARMGALAVGPVLAILVLGLLLLRRRDPSKARPRVRTLPVPAVAGPATTAVTVPTETPRVQDAHRAFLRDQLGSIAEKDPALVASLLQAWVKEDKGART
ncbi:MAG: flagellar basal-body MS-ring/collar protein FliF, partial [Chloroflexota bacterium]